MNTLLTDPNMQDKNGNTPLHLTSDKDKNKIKLLLLSGADPTIINKYGKKALYPSLEYLLPTKSAKFLAYGRRKNRKNRSKRIKKSLKKIKKV